MSRWVCSWLARARWAMFAAGPRDADGPSVLPIKWPSDGPAAGPLLPGEWLSEDGSRRLPSVGRPEAGERAARPTLNVGPSGATREHVTSLWAPDPGPGAWSGRAAVSRRTPGSDVGRSTPTSSPHGSVVGGRDMWWRCGPFAPATERELGGVRADGERVSAEPPRTPPARDLEFHGAPTGTQPMYSLCAGPAGRTLPCPGSATRPHQVAKVGVHPQRPRRASQAGTPRLGETMAH